MALPRWVPHKGHGTAGRVFNGLGEFPQRGEDVPTAASIDLLQNGELSLHEMLAQGLEQRLPWDGEGQAYGSTIALILASLR